MSTEVALKPCPFCGCDTPIVKILEASYWNRCIECPRCFCKTGEYNGGNEGHMRDMRVAWNRRAPGAECTDTERDAADCAQKASTGEASPEIVSLTDALLDLGEATDWQIPEDSTPSAVSADAQGVVGHSPGCAVYDVTRPELGECSCGFESEACCGRPQNWGANINKAIELLMNGCNAMLGLAQLLSHRDDLPPEVLEVLRNNHRIDEAREALIYACALQRSPSPDAAQIVEGREK